MHRSVVVVVLALGSVAHAEPRPGAIGLAAHVVSAVHDGDCDAVRSLVARMRELDPAYYLRTFATDAAIGACVSPPPPITDASDGPHELAFGVSAGFGTGLQGDVRAGRMIANHVAIFGSLTAGGAIAEGGNAYAIGALGARLWFPGDFDRLFVDARAGYGRGYHEECDHSLSCTRHGLGFVGGFGLEAVRTRSLGIELELTIAYAGEAGGLVAALGLNHY